MVTLLCILWAALKGALRTKWDLIVENVALQQQLSVYKRTSKRPRLRPSERAFWSGLSKVRGNWRSALITVKPDTVIRRHRQGFRILCIVHLNVSDSPGLDWVKHQIRDAAPVGEEPKYLVHDNDGLFGQFGKRRRVEVRDGTSEKAYRCHLDSWLEAVMGITGIAIGYGAPNANSRLERFHRALREEALNHFTFFNEEHVMRVCLRYIEYYNHARPSQAHNRIPARYLELSLDKHGKLHASEVKPNRFKPPVFRVFAQRALEGRHRAVGIYAPAAAAELLGHIL